MTMRGIIVVLLLIGFTSCDAWNTFDGIVIDSNSNKPDSGVLVFRVETINDYVITDSLGKFHFDFISRTHKDEEFLFYKAGYVPVKKR